MEQYRRRLRLGLVWFAGQERKKCFVNVRPVSSLPSSRQSCSDCLHNYSSASTSKYCNPRWFTLAKFCRLDPERALALDENHYKVLKRDTKGKRCERRGGGFFLACKDLGRTFDDSLPLPAFFLFFFLKW